MLTLGHGPVRLVATTLDFLDAEDRDPGSLAAALGVPPPVAWPPEFNGPEYRGWQRRLLTANPEEPGYAGWYVLGAGELVGTAGYKGPPDGEGIVEVGYSIIAPRRRRGFAAAAVALLVERALADSRVQHVLAETLPDGAASQAVLRANGFRLDGSRRDPDGGEVLRFVRTR